MKTLDNARTLAMMGFYVFPLYANEKTPAITDFTRRSSCELTGVRDLWLDPLLALESDRNVAIATTKYGVDGRALLVLDVDNKHKGVNGFDTLEFLADLGQTLPPTLTQITASGGQHMIYWVENPVSQTSGVIGPGLDTRSLGGYIVAAGSEINGKVYTFKDITVPVARAPDWLVEKHTREVKESPYENFAGGALAINQPRAEKRALEYLNSLEPALEGTRNNKSYLAACKIKDFGISHDGAVVAMCDAFKAPGITVEEIRHVVRSAYSYGKNPVGVDSPEAAFDKVEVPPETPNEPKKKSPFEAMNDEFAFVMAGSSAEILWFTETMSGHKRVEHLETEDFHKMLDNQTVRVGEDDKPKKISRLWMAWKDRRSYVGVAFEPGMNNPKFYNKWQGFTCEPSTTEPTEKAKNALKLFQDHVLRNICLGVQKDADWVMGWLAHMFQRPGEKVRTALALRGRKGTGKSTVFDLVAELLGEHYLSTASYERITKAFNAHLEGKLMTVLEEAFWSGNKNADSILKDLVTNPRMYIERKGRDIYTVSNYSRIVVLGNADWIVPATEDERRYAVFDLAETNRGDEEFFGSMKDNMDYSLLLKFFLEFDLSTVNVNKIPNTKALLEQKHLGQNGIKKWLLESLQTDSFTGRGDQWATEIRVDDLRRILYAWLDDQGIRGRKPTSEAIGKDLRQVFPGLKRTRVMKEKIRHYEYSLPDLNGAREYWEKYIGHKIEWDVEET